MFNAGKYDTLPSIDSACGSDGSSSRTAADQVVLFPKKPAASPWANAIPPRDPDFDDFGGWTRPTLEEQHDKFRGDCRVPEDWSGRIIAGDLSLHSVKRRDRIDHYDDYLASPLKNKSEPMEKTSFFDT